MYLISALLSYGYKKMDVDRSNTYRQKFFFEDEKREVFVIKDGKVEEVSVDLGEFEHLFSYRKLLLPPSYPDTLQDLKYEIYSYKNDSR